MNILFYGIITTVSILFVLIILLILSLAGSKTARLKETEIRCNTCGQILEPNWNRCPFCAEVSTSKTFPSTETIPDLPPVGYLIVKSGIDRGKIFKVEKDSVTIGNGNYNDVIIKDNSVSPQHARITLNNKKFSITDLNSHGGTKVNNRVTENAEIFDNDAITIGDNIFIFKILE
ncbi:MAG: FHA domain-containing protein [Spirochaetes bacterium]|nr:FHA domain-containing protein [Spirochaetota bacterium]